MRAERVPTRREPAGRTHLSVFIICPFVPARPARGLPHRRPLLFACNLCIQTSSQPPSGSRDGVNRLTRGTTARFPCPARGGSGGSAANVRLPNVVQSFLSKSTNLNFIKKKLFLCSNWTKNMPFAPVGGKKLGHVFLFSCVGVVGVTWRREETFLSSPLLNVPEAPPPSPPHHLHPLVLQFVFESVVWLCAPPASHCSAN